MTTLRPPILTTRYFKSVQDGSIRAIPVKPVLQILSADIGPPIIMHLADADVHHPCYFDRSLRKRLTADGFLDEVYGIANHGVIRVTKTEVYFDDIDRTSKPTIWVMDYELVRKTCEGMYRCTVPL